MTMMNWEKSYKQWGEERPEEIYMPGLTRDAFKAGWDAGREEAKAWVENAVQCIKAARQCEDRLLAIKHKLYDTP